MDEKMRARSESRSRTVELAVFANNRLLNAILLDPSILERADVDRGLFMSKSSMAVFDAIEKLVEDGAVNPSATHKLSREQVYEEASTRDVSVTPEFVSAIFSFSDEKPSTVVDMIRHLRAAKKALRAVNLLKSAIDEAESGAMTPELAEKVRGLIADADADLTSTDDDDIKRVYTADQWMEKYLEETSGRRNGKQYPYGHKILDDLIVEGATPGDGLVLCSSTGMGKTTTCINLVDSFLEQGVPCLFFSSEMSLTSIMDRYISKKLEIPFRDIVRPQNPSDFDSIREQITQFRERFSENTYFRFSADPKPSIVDVGKAVKKFQADIDMRYCVVFLDLLSMVKEFADSREGTNFSQTIELALNKLNAVAKMLHFHWIGTVQLNRTVESEKIHTIDDIHKTRPTRASLKNSNAYLERARTTIGLWRPYAFAKEYIKKEELDSLNLADIQHFIILKSNSNAIEERKALFVPETFTIIPTEEGDMLANDR